MVEREMNKETSLPPSSGIILAMGHAEQAGRQAESHICLVFIFN